MNIDQAQPNPDYGEKIREFLVKMKESNERAMIEAFKRAEQKAKENRKQSRRKVGVVSLSNTDTIQRCVQIRARLYAKIGEIAGSDLDIKQKMALTRDVMTQIDKVEIKISEIRRRERAVKEEKTAKKTEAEHVKRKRWYDTQKRTAHIRKDYLFPAEKGGFDPYGFSPDIPITPAVSFDISGLAAGELSDVSAETAEAMVEVLL